jgi:SAM-dependent methyltransferase
VTEPDLVDLYSRIAEQYARQTPNNVYNALYERPAMLSLLPELAGARVLDAGCGPGIYAELFLQRGAAVTCIDASPEMVRLASQRIGDRAEVRQHDVHAPLEWLASASFDLVFSALVLHYVRDWTPVLREFARVLAPGGALVFSTGHPLAELELSPSGCYYEIEAVSEHWPNFGVTMRYYRRPLSAMMDAIFSAGFVLEAIHEPRPLQEAAERDPKAYEILSRRPAFVCFRSRKPLASAST